MNDDKVKSNKFKIYIFIIIGILVVLGIILMILFYKKNTENNSIDIVISGDNLDISVDAVNWSNEISKKDLIDAKFEYYNNTNQLPDSLSYMSTIGVVNDGKMNIFRGIISDFKNNNYNIQSNKVSDFQCLGDKECNENNYIVFDLFFRTDKHRTIAIGKDTIITSQVDNENSYLVNAIRLGFITEGMIPYNSSKERSQSLKGGTYSIIWEPNYDVRTETGLKNAKEIYGIEIDSNNNLPITYKGINSQFENKVNITDISNSSYFTTISPTIKTMKKMEYSERLIDLSEGITKVRVYIWLEGQDVDMMTNKSTSNIKININLEDLK